MPGYVYSSGRSVDGTTEVLSVQKVLYRLACKGQLGFGTQLFKLVPKLAAQAGLHVVHAQILQQPSDISQEDSSTEFENQRNGAS